MSFNRKIWEKGKIDNIPCPICGKTMEFKELSTTQTYMGKLYAEAHEIRNEFYFIGKLTCSQHNIYYAYGLKETDEFVYDYENELTKEYATYQIKGMYPTLCLFEIPSKCSDNEKKELWDAFSLFWNDSNACANKLRRCIESLLNKKRIPKISKRKRLNLKKRIDIFENKTPKLNISPYLQAIRVIGNIGSHQKEVSKGELLDCFEFINKIFETLYLKKEKELEAKAKKIAHKK